MKVPILNPSAYAKFWLRPAATVDDTPSNSSVLATRINSAGLASNATDGSTGYGLGQRLFEQFVPLPLDPTRLDRSVLNQMTDQLLVQIRNPPFRQISG